jgi:hypothetical protein
MADSGTSAIGLINLDMKETGKPSAGNLHAGFDLAGAGNQLTVWLMRHSQRKRRATDRPNLRSVAPVLDPTCESLGVRFPGPTHLSTAQSLAVRLDCSAAIDGTSALPRFTSAVPSAL